MAVGASRRRSLPGRSACEWGPEQPWDGTGFKESPRADRWEAGGRCAAKEHRDLKNISQDGGGCDGPAT